MKYDELKKNYKLYALTQIREYGSNDYDEDYTYKYFDENDNDITDAF
jgi:hypothetical protein